MSDVADKTKHIERHIFQLLHALSLQHNRPHRRTFLSFVAGAQYQHVRIVRGTNSILLFSREKKKKRKKWRRGLRRRSWRQRRRLSASAKQRVLRERRIPAKKNGEKKRIKERRKKRDEKKKKKENTRRCRNCNRLALGAKGPPAVVVAVAWPRNTTFAWRNASDSRARQRRGGWQIGILWLRGKRKTCYTDSPGPRSLRPFTHSPLHTRAHRIRTITHVYKMDINYYVVQHYLRVGTHDAV